MLASPRPLQLLKIVGPSLVTLWLLKSIFSYRAGYEGLTRHFRDERELFISDFLDHEVDGHFDGQPLSELCASKQWIPDLILSCEPPTGGFSHIRNAQLNCIRFAIEAGAELIAPNLVKRVYVDISQSSSWHGGGPVRGDPLDYFFDFTFLKQTLSSFCPQMKLHRSLDDLWDVPSLSTANPISLHTIHATLNDSVLVDPSTLSDLITKHINTVSPLDKRTLPIRFHLPATNWVFPTAPEPPHLAHNFGRVLRIRPEIRRLAAAVLYSLSTRYHLNIDPRMHSFSSNNFTALHLRTEEDAAYAFPPFEEQVSALFNFTLSSSKGRKPLAYLATGAVKEETDRFVEKAKEVGVMVVRKEDLLEGEELRELNALSWDQKALVDYGVMLRAGGMAGQGGSSFDWGVLLRREGVRGVKGEVVKMGLDEHGEEERGWKGGGDVLFGVYSKGGIIRDTTWP